MSYDLSAVRLDRSRPLREQIYPMVRSLLLTGAIKPGEVIDEKAIAAQLHVSRTPVREAVKRLSDEHLIDVVAQSATRAAKIDAKEIEESFLIRRALEMESAAQAAAHMNQDHADRLHDILMMHARAVERKHFIEAIARDDEFHRYISEISDLPRLWSTIEISKAQLDRCRHLMLPRAGRSRENARTAPRDHPRTEQPRPSEGQRCNEGASRCRLPQHGRRAGRAGAGLLV
jgi:GntR family transcriptional regulator, rspAB operon transcriptional repressor